MLAALGLPGIPGMLSESDRPLALPFARLLLQGQSTLCLHAQCRRLLVSNGHLRQECSTLHQDSRCLSPQSHSQVPMYKQQHRASKECLCPLCSWLKPAVVAMSTALLTQHIWLYMPIPTFGNLGSSRFALHAAQGSYGTEGTRGRWLPNHARHGPWSRTQCPRAHANCHHVLCPRGLSFGKLELPFDDTLCKSSKV